MKNRFLLRILYIFSMFIMLSVSISACISDSSPLRSDIEVAINKTFGMDFGYLDQVQVFSNDKEIHKINGESVRDIVLLLSKATKIEDKIDLPKNATYKIVLSTSKEGMQFNKDQSEAELLVYPQGDYTYLRYNDQLYKLSESLSSYGIK